MSAKSAITPDSLTWLGFLGAVCVAVSYALASWHPALLWLATGIVLTALSAWRSGLNTIAGWFGVRSYPPAVLFAVGILFILAVLLHYSTVISRLSDQNVVLAQRLALLETELRSRDSR